MDNWSDIFSPEICNFGHVKQEPHLDGSFRALLLLVSSLDPPATYIAVNIVELSFISFIERLPQVLILDLVLIKLTECA